VRAVTFGAVSPVDGWSEQHSDDKNQRKQGGFNMFHGKKLFVSMLPWSGGVKSMTFQLELNPRANVARVASVTESCHQPRRRGCPGAMTRPYAPDVQLTQRFDGAGHAFV
jgi:hypothetical protein